MDVLGVESSCIHNGIDFNNFYYSKNNKKFDILFVGSFQERKRPDLIVQIADSLPNLNFLLVGQGPLKNNLLDKCKINGIKNVKFKSNVSQKKLGDLMRQSRIFFIS